MNIVIPIIMSSIGLLIIFIPTETMLRFDRQSGYWVYKKKLKSSGDKEKALKAAGIFYKIFGIVFMIFPLIFLWTNID